MLSRLKSSGIQSSFDWRLVTDVLEELDFSTLRALHERYVAWKHWINSLYIASPYSMQLSLLGLP